MGCSWFNTETNKRKTSINNKKTWIRYVDKKSRYETQISSCSIATLSHVHMYATTRYNFVHLKATHKISPLEELVGGRSPPPPLAVPRG